VDGSLVNMTSQLKKALDNPKQHNNSLYELNDDTYNPSGHQRQSYATGRDEMSFQEPTASNNHNSRGVISNSFNSPNAADNDDAPANQALAEELDENDDDPFALKF